MYVPVCVSCAGMQEPVAVRRVKRSGVVDDCELLWGWLVLGFLRQNLPLYIKLGLQMMPIYILLEKPKLKFVTYPK